MTQHLKCWVNLLTDPFITVLCCRSSCLPFCFWLIRWNAWFRSQYPWAQDLDEVWSWQLDASSNFYGNGSANFSRGNSEGGTFYLNLAKLKSVPGFREIGTTYLKPPL
jgi:hypothetical protein